MTTTGTRGTRRFRACGESVEHAAKRSGTDITCVLLIYEDAVSDHGLGTGGAQERGDPSIKRAARNAGGSVMANKGRKVSS